MPHSTTGTTSYTLAKYSRAYPSKRAAQRAQKESQNASELASEWQHFTNPTIRLVLDVKSTPNDGIESVRLRILWQINSEMDSGYNNQQDVVFEDLDLLSFSNDIAPGVAHRHNLEGLPLKAVYRDTVVGIRYLFSREIGATPTYRRFQISFHSTSEASEFINSIKPVCPCKINAMPVQVPTANLNAQSQIVSLPVRPVSQVQASRPGLVHSENNRSQTFACPPPPSHHSMSATPGSSADGPHHMSHTSTPYALSSSPLGHIRADHSSTSMLSSSGSPPRAAQSIPRMPMQSENFYHLPLQNQSSLPTGRRQESHVNPVGTNIASHINPANLSASLPASSFSASSSDLTQRHEGTDANTRKESSHSILASLVDSTSIYELPTSTLERVVGEVIREDGFITLVKRLSEMFTIQRVVDRHVLCATPT